MFQRIDQQNARIVDEELQYSSSGVEVQSLPTQETPQYLDTVPGILTALRWRGVSSKYATRIVGYVLGTCRDLELTVDLRRELLAEYQHRPILLSRELAELVAFADPVQLEREETEEELPVNVEIEEDDPRNAFYEQEQFGYELTVPDLYQFQVTGGTFLRNVWEENGQGHQDTTYCPMFLGRLEVNVCQRCQHYKGTLYNPCGTAPQIVCGGSLPAAPTVGEIQDEFPIPLHMDYATIALAVKLGKTSRGQLFRLITGNQLEQEQAIALWQLQNRIDHARDSISEATAHVTRTMVLEGPIAAERAAKTNAQYLYTLGIYTKGVELLKQATTALEVEKAARRAEAALKLKLYVKPCITTTIPLELHEVNGKLLWAVYGSQE